MRYILAALFLTGVRTQLILPRKPPLVDDVLTTQPPPPPTTFQTYLVGVPRCISAGRPADVFVEIFGEGPNLVTVDLFDTSTNVTHAITQNTVDNGIAKTISLEVPADLPRFGNFYIRVSGTGPTPFQNRTEVSVRYNTVAGFVQTDKAVYKPGDVVNYRIFSLFPDLKINKGVYNIEIRDPKNNKIRDDKGVTNNTGLIGGSLALSDEPIFGSWRIQVSETGTKKAFNKIFEVKEYVLPRMEVTVNPPPFIVFNQTRFEVVVTGKYAFGDDVRGSLRVSAKIAPWWSRRKEEIQPVSEKTIPDFVGSATVSFDTKDILPPNSYFYSRTVFVEADLTERLTGNEVSGSGSSRIYEVAEKMHFLSYNSNTFKPGLTYKAFVKISQQDGSPVDGSLEDFRVVADFTHQVTHKAEATLSVTPSLPQDSLGEFAFQRIPPSCFMEDVTRLRVSLKVLPGGVLEITIPTVPENAERLTLRATYRRVSAYWSANRAKSPSNAFLQISLAQEDPKPGDIQTLQVKSTTAIDSLSLLVTSRGRFVIGQEFKRPTAAKELNIPVEITHAMAPRARVVAYYKTASGEIVADTITFDVKDPFETKVSVGFSAEEVQPGDDVTMTVQTAPNSLVATLVLDKKVLLLKTGNDITEKQVVGSLRGLDCRGYGSGQDAQSIFEIAGLIVLTDSILYGRSISYARRGRFDGTGGFTGDTGLLARKSSNAGPVADNLPSAESEENLQPVGELRKAFPDTWLFKVEVADSNGEVNIPTTAPDSITTWQATAFAFNDQTGFGITTQPGKLIVAKPFFANLFLPYSVIRGEEMLLQVNVFNNLRENQTVVVELQGSTSYMSLDIDDAGNEVLVAGARTQTLTVPSGIPKSVVFPIRTTEVGDIPITVTARSAAAADGLTKTLKIEPEGVPDEYNFIALVNLTKSSPYSTTRSIRYPDRVVEDSQRLGVKIVGDVLGGTFANAARLVRMSYGCGEQNMVNFAPTVFVSRYLETVGQLTGQRRDNAISFISSGYQRQLNYKRGDGSYSAFGERDSSGNVWLTAFVVKSFSAAASQDLLSLDSRTLDSSYRFLTAHQNKLGQFRDAGKLHNKMLRGESGRGDALTAYVLAALLENPLTNIDLSEPIERAQRYVEGYVQNTTDVYELAIGAYALALAGSSQVDSVLSKLESMVTIKDGRRYWRVIAEPVYRWQPPRRRSQAASIETTSYVCLVYALRQDIPKMAQCLTYLVGEQNDQGGYVSTQDTVVAIQALSAIAPSFYSPTQSGSLSVEAGGSTASFTVNDANRFVLQRAILPVSANNVTVTGSGSGVFLMSISVRYNIENDLVEPAFSLSATLTKDTPTAIDLTVCSTYLLGEATSMANIEIRLPSGFTLTAESKEDLLTTVKRVETLDGKVLLYLDEITNRGICLRLSATGSGNINKPKPNPVRVFDYYNPDDSALTLYSLKSLEGGFCDSAVCTSDPTGCSANCSKRRRK